jgi:hypothetical protein
LHDLRRLPRAVHRLPRVAGRLLVGTHARRRSLDLLVGSLFTPHVTAIQADVNYSLFISASLPASLLELTSEPARKRPCSTEKTEVETKLTAETYGIRQWIGTRAKDTKEAGTHMTQLALSVAKASLSYFCRTCSTP